MHNFARQSPMCIAAMCLALGCSQTPEQQTRPAERTVPQSSQGERSAKRAQVQAPEGLESPANVRESPQREPLQTEAMRSSGRKSRDSDARETTVRSRQPSPNAGETPQVRLRELPEQDEEEREPTYQDTAQHRKLVGLSNSFPWAGDRKGGWSGTGYEDPPPLRKFSDDKMLQMASDKGDKSDERQHALVSVGRRKMPGALAALESALTDHKEIYQVREMGLSGLIEHGGPKALELMWRALKEDPSASIRGMAIWAIALYGTAESEAAVMHGLSDPEPEVKGMAVLAVWALKDRKDKALSILEDTAKVTERVIWQESLNVLARMPYPEAADILYKIAKNDTGPKQQSAIMYYRAWLRAHPDLAGR